MRLCGPVLRKSVRRDRSSNSRSTHTISGDCTLGSRSTTLVSCSNGSRGQTIGDRPRRECLALCVRLEFVRSRALSERSEEHTSELQSRSDLVCRLLLEKKKHDTDRRCVILCLV